MKIKEENKALSVHVTVDYFSGVTVAATENFSEINIDRAASVREGAQDI